MRYAKRKAKDLLKLWITHLIFCEVKPKTLPADSFLICKDKTQKFDRPSNPQKILQELLELFRQGLTEPIHFFPETSLVYVQRIQSEKHTRQGALSGARSKWEGDDYGYNPGEGHDPYYQRCFENTDPIDDVFEDIAKRVYEPLLAHLTDVVI